MAQLMAEATDIENSGNQVLADELKNYDVIHGLYEGGGKTWESSVDLAAMLVADYSFLLSEDVEEVRIIEVRLLFIFPSRLVLASPVRYKNAN